MGKIFNLKKWVNIILGVPALIIFAGEAGSEYFGLQIAAAAVLVGLFMWNVAFCREELV